MKKKYMKPEMEAINIKTQGILCGSSITQNGDCLNIVLIVDEFEDNETIN